MGRLLSAWIEGKAEPKGSTRSFVRGGRAITTSDNPALRAWGEMIASEVRWRIDGQARHPGPFSVGLTFILARPASHRTPRGALRRSSPPQHQQPPDLDKLCRAVLDALTAAGLWADDAQVTHLAARKRWTQRPEEPAGVAIVVEGLDAGLALG